MAISWRRWRRGRKTLATGKFSRLAWAITAPYSGAAAVVLIGGICPQPAAAPTVSPGEPPQRHDREQKPVQVVVDVEVRWEARARVLGLVPGAVGALCIHEPAHAPVHGRRALTRGVQGEQGPGGL